MRQGVGMATSASTAVGTSVRAAASAWLGTSTRTTPLQVLGTHALLFHRSDRHEQQRRRHAVAARLDRLDPLQTLLHLPVGVPVEAEALPASVREGLQRLPHGAAEEDGQRVTRHAVRPLTVDLAVVRTSPSRWRAGLRQAARFAPFCARALYVGRLPDASEELLMEASFYGIGVLTHGTGETEMLLEPRHYRPLRHTAAAWYFTEQLYQRLP